MKGANVGRKAVIRSVTKATKKQAEKLTRQEERSKRLLLKLYDKVREFISRGEASGLPEKHLASERRTLSWLKAEPLLVEALAEREGRTPPPRRRPSEGMVLKTMTREVEFPDAAPRRRRNRKL